MAKIEIDTDSPLNDEMVTALKTALETSGFHVLSDGAFKGVKEAGAKPHKETLASLQSEYDELKEKHKEAAEKLKELEREKMTDAERAAAELKDREDMLAQLREQAASEKSEKERISNAWKEARLEARMSDLLANVRPELAKAAKLLATSELKGLGVTEDGALTLRDATGADLVGDDAQGRFSEWWSKQTQFHNPQNPGPGTRGSAQPSPKNNGDWKPLSPLEGSFQERAKAAMRAEYERRQQGK